MSNIWIIFPVALVLVVAIFLGIIYYFSGLLLYPNRQPIVHVPSEYGLEYEDISFTSIDGINLKGWLIPGTSDKLIIMTHPMTFNRHGFLAKNQGFMKITKLDVDFLALAKVLKQEGYWILMFDFRNHGESDKSQTGRTGLGLNEYQDILGALKYVKSHPSLKNKKIGFVSFCMGANTTIIAMSKARDQFNDVRCLAAIQPISFNVFVRSFIRANYSRLGVLFMFPVLNKICQWRGDYRSVDMSPQTYVKDIRTPCFYVQAKTDRWTELSDIRGFYEETPDPKELLILEDKMERFDTYNYFSTHPEKLIMFLKKNMT